MPTIKHKMTIETPSERVREALTSTEELTKWFMQAEGSAIEGGEVKLSMNEDHYHIFRVSLVADDRIIWEEKVSKGPMEGIESWKGSVITFNLEEKALERLEGKICTVLRFSHELQGKEDDFFAECNYYWAFFLTKMKELCEADS